MTYKTLSQHNNKYFYFTESIHQVIFDLHIYQKIILIIDRLLSNE